MIRFGRVNRDAYRRVSLTSTCALVSVDLAETGLALPDLAGIGFAGIGLQCRLYSVSPTPFLLALVLHRHWPALPAQC